MKMKGWHSVNHGDKTVYNKNGFIVTLDNKDDSINVCFNYEQIQKPFYNLDQALYWCEGRMFERDEIKPNLIQYSDISEKDINKFKNIGSVTFFNDDTREIVEEVQYYKGKDNSEFSNTYAKETWRN